MANLNAQRPSANALNCGTPQMNTNTVRMTHGNHACTRVILPLVAVVVSRASAAASGSTRELSSRLRRAVEVQIVLGFHTFRNSVSVPIDTSAAITSTSHGPWKFDTRNCGIANDTPATRIAGQICSMPRKPANAQISQNGTSTEKNGNWRPTMAESCSRSSPVTEASPMSGAPSAP